MLRRLEAVECKRPGCKWPSMRISMRDLTWSRDREAGETGGGGMTALYKKALVIGVAMLSMALCPDPAAAAQGDLVGQVHFERTCANSLTLGVGIAFDGDNIWYSCFATGAQPDLFRANPVTGQVTASYNIAGGLGALAFDRVHQILW